MIPADADLDYLKEHYALKVRHKGKTLQTVDDVPQWVDVTEFSATCLGKPLHAIMEILAEKVTPELRAERTEKFLNTLKVEILRREEAEAHG